MTIERKQPYGAIDELALSAFEKCLPAPLPSDLRAFLLEFNGAHFTGLEAFDDDVNDHVLDDVFGLHSGPNYLRLDQMRDGFAQFAPASLLIFAADPYGNYFATALAGTDRGCIFFVDHEQLPVALETLPRVAGSFSELLQRSGSELRVAPPPSSVAEAVRDGDLNALREMAATGTLLDGHVHHAVHQGNLEVVKAVLELGGDPNERGGIGGKETPLFVAARRDRADIAELLIARGADPNARSSDGGTAIEMATPFPRVLLVLWRAGAEPTTRLLREAVKRMQDGP